MQAEPGGGHPGGGDALRCASPPGWRVVILGISSGGRSDRTLPRATCAHVRQDPRPRLDELEDFYRELESRAAESIAELADPFREAGMEILEQVVYGERAREIVTFAREEAFDLVVTTSRPLDPDDPDLGPANWPTISHKVAIMSEVPVLLVR